VEGETPRERAFAIRTYQFKAREAQRTNKRAFTSKFKPAILKKELSAEKQAILNKYKPEEIQALSEVIPVIAESQGYVRQTSLLKINIMSELKRNLINSLKNILNTPKKKTKTGYCGMN